MDDLKCRESGDSESKEELSRSWRDRYFFSPLLLLTLPSSFFFSLYERGTDFFLIWWLK